MTKEDILKNFPFSVDTDEKHGICTTCKYFENCDKMLPGFIRPGKCGGPFNKINN